MEKHFSDMEDWKWESALYAVLQDRLPIPKVLEDLPGLLVTQYVPAITLLEELQRQEKRTFDPEPWQALADWLIRCRALCGRLPTEGNLRNFLWNAETKTLTGVDLECFHEESISQCGAGVIAWLLTYYPEDTEVKLTAAALLQRELLISSEAVKQETERLRLRRKGKWLEPISGIILGGGHSRRMGQDKVGLPLCGKTLLECQVEKMRMLGIRDIIVSGADAPKGTRRVEDVYPDRGPLGGLHACLQRTQNPACLVLGVDIPLVPLSALDQLRRSHRQGITVLTHQGFQEPLIGMYDSCLCEKIETLIRDGSAPVRALEKCTEWNAFEYQGPAEYLKNCNHPEDYIRVCSIAIQHAEKGLPLV